MKQVFAAAILGVFFAGVLASRAAEEKKASGKAATLAPSISSNDSAQKLGQIPNFSLLDYRGKYHELRRTDAPVVVLFFTANGCPIARQSISKIRALRSKFAKQGVVFWMVDSNSGDDRESIAEEAREFSVGSIPILMDDAQALARTLGIKRTCETVAIATTNLTIFYRGAIDDQLSEGAQKPEAREAYLRNALTEFLEEKPVTRPTAPVRGCLISFADGSKSSAATLSYANDVVPILQQKCVGCHTPGNIGPWSMTSYKKVKSMSDMIQEVVLERRMPPWHLDPHVGKFQNDRSLTAAETTTLLRWIEQGAPRGDGPDSLTNVVATENKWPHGKPDYVVALPKKQTIPATGVLDYRFIDADFEMPEDAWIRAAPCRPDNRKVVHHIIVRVRYPAGHRSRSTEEVFFSSWAPGNTWLATPEGTGKFLPKGATFNFEMHYTTIGKEEIDQSELGLYVMKEKPKMVLETRATETRELDIAPGDPNAKSFCLYNFKRDSLIFDLVPHMHLRGSWFKYEALYPNGKRELLLSVPHYDFNWQTEYRLAEPKKVPAGTWILCTGGHDNSPRNPLNPDSTKRIRWGLQSWDEMFMGFMNVAELPDASTNLVQQARSQ